MDEYLSAQEANDRHERKLFDIWRYRRLATNETFPEFKLRWGKDMRVLMKKYGQMSFFELCESMGKVEE